MNASAAALTAFLNSSRVIEDYAVVFFGSAAFKMLRLFLVAAFSVHLFACVFYRVKDSSDDQDAVMSFYEVKEASYDVSASFVRLESAIFSYPCQEKQMG